MWYKSLCCQCALQDDSWPEVLRRYFALAATAVLVKGTEASGGLDTALGALVGATPLALLGPFAVLQSLTAGGQTGEPAAAGAARLPLVRCMSQRLLLFSVRSPSSLLPGCCIASFFFLSSEQSPFPLLPVLVFANVEMLSCAVNGLQ